MEVPKTKVLLTPIGGREQALTDLGGRPMSYEISGRIILKESGIGIPNLLVGLHIATPGGPVFSAAK